MIVSKSPSTGGVVVWSYGSFGVSFELSKIVVVTEVVSITTVSYFDAFESVLSVICTLYFSPLSAK